MARRPSKVFSEDIRNLNLAGRPHEIEISWFGGRPIAYMPPETFPRETLEQIARALVDRGWSQGVRYAEVRVEQVIDQAPDGPQLLTRMCAELRYGSAR